MIDQSHDDVPARQSDDVPALVEHAFRRWHSRLMATLIRSFGTARIDLVEEAVQDALLSALERWAFRGIPDRPDAWLYQVARRKALDRLARDATAVREEAALAHSWESSVSAIAPVNVALDSLGDDELTMLFLCAHPALGVETQVALMLRTVCGLTVQEIAAALIVPDATIAQRIVRAKRVLADLDAPFVLPAPDALADRMGAVLRAIYLLFTEGYAATSGDASVRHDLCHEAIRLAESLARTNIGESTELFALCALMQLQSSRLDAREHENGSAVPLAEQDRSRWNPQAIARGFTWLERAAHGDIVTEYHLQAGIAATHAAAPDASQTDWHRIRGFYEELLRRTASPIVRLNYALAVARTDGPRAALALLDELAREKALSGYHLLPAMQAALYHELGDRTAAAAHTRDALARARTTADRQLLRARLAALAPEATSDGVLHTESSAELTH